ncbi:uncharacterized protein Tco025E_05275 [Trypanosoma conorhini]|uniref:Uncharacterized protein n=1 Tax=Trypanosoma conorhini TaxID=83891 RepID=A0A422PEQ3_9TRYP|nr:uncharacterized protein Tco025E_05275 [Trypanosoma conorhini]RNF16163.1 hypothetical protein Tco025E_05275 [Trypanosoma conorhini]
MSVFVIPHSGMYHGNFEFAVVMSGKQPSKLKVSVYDEQQKRVVYSTKDTWHSGRKLALPPGEYCVRAELVAPRLDGSNLLLDAVEMRYSVLHSDRGASPSSTPLSGHILRDELASSGSHLRLRSPMSAEDAAPVAARADVANGGESASRFGSFPPSRRSMSEVNVRASSFAGNSTREEAADVWRSSSRATPNAALQCLRDPTPAQALQAFSEAPSRRATPFVARNALGAAGTAKQQQPASSSAAEARRSPTPHPLEPPAEEDTHPTVGADPQHATSWLWKLSPTPVNEAKAAAVARASPGSADAATADEQISGARTADGGALVATPPQQQQQQHSGDRAEPARMSTRPSPPSGTTARPRPSEVVGVRPANPEMPQERSCGAAHTVPLSHTLTPDNLLGRKTHLSHRDWTPLVVRAELVRDREEKKRSNSPERQSVQNQQSTAQPVMPTPLTGSTVRQLKSSTALVTRDNNERSPNRSSAQVQSPRLSSGKHGSKFVIPPPDFIDVHKPFCLALAFGAANAEPKTDAVFLHVLLEAEVEAGVKPQEPVVCVTPATFAAIPTRAQGINYHWVCSPSIRANERSGLMDMLGDVTGKAHTAVAISTACVGPSCDGQTLSGLQFVLDSLDGETSSCQFFVSFREVEEMSNEDEAAAVQDGILTDNSDAATPATGRDRNRQPPTLDERALGAEFIYNSLPCIRCVVDGGGEMALEVHRKNVVVAREPVYNGSRVAMYFGTTTAKVSAATSGDGDSAGAGEQQPYLSILVDYRTVFCYVIRSERGLDALRVIMMSRVESSSMVESGAGARMRLRELELLSHQRRLVAFADEVRLDDAKASQLSNGSRRGQYEEGGGTNQPWVGAPCLLSAWVAGESPGMCAWRRVTLV